MEGRYTQNWFKATKINAHIAKEACEKLIAICDQLIKEEAHIDYKNFTKYSYYFPEFNELSKALNSLAFTCRVDSWTEKAEYVANDVERMEEEELAQGIPRELLG